MKTFEKYSQIILNFYIYLKSDQELLKLLSCLFIRKFLIFEENCKFLVRLRLELTGKIAENGFQENLVYVTFYRFHSIFVRFSRVL